MNTAQHNTVKPAASGFFLLASLQFLLLWTLANHFLSAEFWQVLIAGILCAIPLVLASYHQSTIRLILHRQQFRPHGLFFRLFSGRFTALIKSLLFGFIAGIFILVSLYMFTAVYWALTAAVIVLFYLVCRLLLQRLHGEFREYVLLARCLRWSAMLTALLISVVLLLFPVSSPVGVTDAGQSQIGMQRQLVASLDGSLALNQIALAVQTWGGLKQDFLQLFGAYSQIALKLFSFAENMLLFFVLCTLFSSAALSRNELRRCFGRLTDEPQVTALTPGNLAMVAAVSSFLLLFVVLPLSAYTELWVRQHQPQIQAAELRVLPQLEQIGDAFYQAGTWDGLQVLRTNLLRELELDTARLKVAIEMAFKATEGNVDTFLDWYYSLGGEYTRIAKLLTGDLETFLSDKLNSTLSEGDHFALVETMLTNAIGRQQVLHKSYLQQAEAHLKRNEVVTGDSQVAPLRQITLLDVMTPPVHEEFIQLQTRLLGSAVGGGTAGLMSSLVAAKLTSRMIAKGSFKLAAKALGKVVAAKATGTAAGSGGGAAVGAAVGSVVPGLGTVVGAVIGGLAGGILAGIGIDKALIELEEAVNREAFRAELVTSINEAKQEFLQSMSGIQ